MEMKINYNDDGCDDMYSMMAIPYIRIYGDDCDLW